MPASVAYENLNFLKDTLKKDIKKYKLTLVRSDGKRGPIIKDYDGFDINMSKMGGNSAYYFENNGDTFVFFKANKSLKVYLL